MNSEEFKCVFCKEIFDDKETLQIHFRKHGDLNFHLNKSRLQDEQLVASDKPAGSKDQPETVQCDVCPEVFTSISKAITHKHKVHPDHDAKYFCPWCGKLFTMKHLYNKHIQSTHADEEKVDIVYHCDVCDVDFNKLAATSYHNKFFHRVYEMPTIGNSKKLKMVGKAQEAIQIYYCPFCGEEYENKVNLHKHMTDDHLDENQHPDDVLRCPICDAVFYHLDAYEIHLTYHSNDDLYSERSALLDEISDFSLESVPPLAEKVETEPQSDMMGIEQLLEVTMDGTNDYKLKKKKHKKHKKSKKSAITLDQFLNMNTDVFGEGLDFQGIEEVPSQALAKRLKKPIKKPVASKLPPNIEKLQRQGIVIKKKGGISASPMLKNNAALNKNSTIVAQSKPSPTETSEVINKLMSQNNSQIKIIKKTSDIKNINDNSMGTKPDIPVDKVTIENKESNGVKNNSTNSGHNNSTQGNNMETEPEKDAYPNNITRKSENLEQNDPKCFDEKSNDSHKSLEKPSIPDIKKPAQVTEKLNALLNNCNIVVKSNKHNVSSDKVISKPSDDDDDITDMEDFDDYEKCTEKDSLNAINNLSHLTVKSSTQENNPQQENTIIDKKVQPDVSKIAHLIKKSPVNSGSIVTKSNDLPEQLNVPPAESKEQEDSEAYMSEEEIDDPGDLKTEHTETSKIASILNNPQLNIQTIKKSPKVEIQTDLIKESSPKTEKSSAALLKHLKNVTAKPISVNKLPYSSPSQRAPPKPVIKKDPVTMPVQHNKPIQDNIEIFNIDDSDSDEANNCNKQIIKPQKEQNLGTKKSIEVFKNINKNITIKSVNNSFSKNDKTNEDKEFDSEGHDEDDEIPPQVTKPRNLNHNTIAPEVCKKQSALKNVLKNLSKNITVKSGNPSPGPFPNQEPLHDSFPDSDDHSDTDSTSGRVKIMEMENDDEEHTDTSDHAHQDNVKVQYPDSNSEDEGNHFSDQNFSEDDIETHLTANTVRKTDNQTAPNPQINSLKNVCKELVIKPAGPSRAQNSPISDEIPPFAKSLSNQMSIKNAKQGDNSNRQMKINNPNPKNIGQTVGHSLNKSSMNQKMVNKEVKTVKTFQSQTETETVIQEITTTVTKTIKTVNQSSKQQSTVQSNIPNKLPQVIGNYANFQNVRVRPATRPVLNGPRPQGVRPGMRPTRPTSASPIRPSNQLVPVRPRFNTPRMSTPRQPIRPSTAPMRPQLRNPGVSGVANTAKRTNAEAGHFSCFKKPKESLFPDEFSAAMNKHDGDSPVQFASAMHMSKSNFACTTKTVKGNSVVTSTQIKSEMSASSQQLGKLKNLSGLSIMKTSQSNQTHAEEKSEVSLAKQKNTLDAIQRLQSQGLLVKKPRLVSEQDEHLGDDDMQNLSDEEFDS